MSDDFYCLSDERNSRPPRQIARAIADPAPVSNPPWATAIIRFVITVGCPWHDETPDRCEVDVAMDEASENADFSASERRIRYSVGFMTKELRGRAPHECEDGVNLFLGLLAHEYGHYLDHATGGEYARAFVNTSAEISAYLDTQPMATAAVQLGELWADSVAGCFLATTKISVGQYDYFLCGSVHSNTHPPKEVRFEAMRAGWRRCDGGARIPDLPDCPTWRP